MTRLTLRAAATLAGFALFAAGLLAVTDKLARPRIVANERAFVLRTLNQVMPVDQYDNSLLDDTVSVSDRELLGTKEPVTVHRARRAGQPAGVVLEPVAPAGYAGPIRILVGIRYDGTLLGVRVISHKETPGLGGDDIEVEKSAWILGFDNKSLENPPLSGWAVKKDGGVFDEFTGATITPRAVVNAVRDALLYYDKHRDELFSETLQ